MQEVPRPAPRRIRRSPRPPTSANSSALNLTPQQLALLGTHPVFGPVTLASLLAAWAVPDLTHIHQISRTLAHQYREAVGPWTAYLGVLQCRPQRLVRAPRIPRCLIHATVERKRNPASAPGFSPIQTIESSSNQSHIRLWSKSLLRRNLAYPPKKDETLDRRALPPHPA